MLCEHPPAAGHFEIANDGTGGGLIEAKLVQGIAKSIGRPAAGALHARSGGASLFADEVFTRWFFLRTGKMPIIRFGELDRFR